jgi:hypothetical protein
MRSNFIPKNISQKLNLVKFFSQNILLNFLEVLKNLLKLATKQKIVDCSRFSMHSN